MRIVNNLDRKLRGWLPVKSITGKSYEIFYSTEIQLKNSGKFLLREGFHEGDIVSIKESSLPYRLFQTYNGPLKVSRKPFRAIVELSTSRILYEKDGKIVEYYVQAENLQPGQYAILSPDRRRIDKATKKYISEGNGGSRFAETWFPLVKHEFEFQYLHYGTYSNGCITVTSGSGWTELYLLIMKSRPRKMYHGTITVVEKIIYK